ncbi:hypothetical protein ACH47X_23315 [Promicromonospora kroppenstedtii]|uniref:DUF8094 domain-containing protein n=1 Tax=Promicromonospora kroppenstedtii TaxID=440482 RepID=A0ABW7XRG0_9MICO
MNSRRPLFPRSGLVPGGALVVTSLLLTGCTTELPVPVADAPVAAAVVSETQERKILEQVTAVVDGAKGDEGAQALEERLSGPALELRRAELRIAASGDDKALVSLSLADRQLILPSEQGWPRSSFVITEQPSEKAPPLLAAFEQPSARDQYKMWGFVYLAPGVTMPQFAEAKLGSPAVAADDTSLKISPQDVAQQYASVLSIDDRSKYAESFGDDDLRQYLRDTGESYLAAIKKEDKEAKGTFEVGYEPTKDPVKAVRTADGGAVVLAALASQETLKAEKGWRLTPSTPSAKALWGNAKGTAVMKVVYRDLVALYVPPAGSPDQVTLLGFHRVPTSVSNK